ncbi:hypothetical protein TRAPUB_14363 [Trametes pubescens]|uniref:Uncharacterized protein n=1 Tax=Trametes pubescens TaxID=154538 RepID=A0A1M2VNR6_TRAPU|nr:hypothetical protein TRAPUB_14363 [Trametes pubescens]
MHAQPTLYALWRSFTQCTFVEPDGDVVFFKNQRGEAMREYRRDSASRPFTTGDARAAAQKTEEAEVSLEGDEAEEVALKLAGL